MFPTPSPTKPCIYCIRMQGVNIVGLNSIWDDQPNELVFANVDCQCVFCTPEQMNNVFHCPAEEDCDMRFRIGDFMLLEKFWDDGPIELLEDDKLFEQVTWFWNDQIPDVNPLDGFEVRAKTQIDFIHARNALVYAGSERMIHYGKAYSLLERHIGANHKDTVFSTTHVILRTRKFKFVELKWVRKPELRHLSQLFKDFAESLFTQERSGAQEGDKNRAHDAFIRRFGTHYVYHGVFGGMYGADFYYSGYGTKPEMKIALTEATNVDLVTAYEHNRVRDFTGPLNGRSFVRTLDGEPEVGPDIWGWHIGGDQYGIRPSSGDYHWRESIENDVSMASIIEHKKLVSFTELLDTYSEGLTEASRTSVRERFKFRVVSMAHYWLMKHYWCFFLDSSCENRRRHPFLREDVNNDRCGQVTQKRLRTRTELEVCIGQEHRESGYTLKSLEPPFGIVKWCKGVTGGGENTDIPSNFPPFSPARRGMCPVVPPAPRWPIFISYCFPKPVGTKSCPKEEFPEYEWNWDWESEMQKSFAEHADDSFKLQGVMMKNLEREDKWININPTSLISSAFPWSYHSDDYYPRLNPWSDWVNDTLEVISRDESRRLEAKRANAIAANTASVTEGEIRAWIQSEKGKILDFFSAETHNQYGQFLSGYTGNNTKDYGAYSLWEKNKIYVLHQVPFIDFNGWTFWDTEDDWDRLDKMGPLPSEKTATHMDPAYIFPYDSDWAGRGDNIYGGQQKHLAEETWTELMQLWAPVDAKHYKTGGIRMDYCCTTVSEEQGDRAVHRLHWPDGHLCIYAHGAIDTTAYKFLQGSVGWDCENGQDGYFKKWGSKIYLDPANEVLQLMDEMADQQRLTHALPTGLYHIQYDAQSEQYFSQNILCMKENTDLERDIELPRDQPFYLMQFQGECQRIRGTFITSVDLTWATEKHHKTPWEESGIFDRAFVELEMNSWGHATAYGRRDHIPDGHYSQEKIMIKYCFYQPVVVYRTGVSVANWDSVAMNTRGEYTYYYDAIASPFCV